MNLPSSTMIFAGTGPGARTLDGCSVEFYRGQPYLGELDEIEHLMAAGNTVLELGCGTGRLTRVLLQRGHPVTAVDNSADMLEALPPEATAVRCDIETLFLEQRFDVALLASYFVNLPDASMRAALIAAARRHLAPGGRLFVQRHDPIWLRSVQPGATHVVEGTSYTIETVSRAFGSADRVGMTIRYDRAGQSWTHTFVADALDEAEIETLLSKAGFDHIAWHGVKRQWVTAR